MPRENYPTGGDITAFLTTAGLTTTGLDVVGAAQAGRDAVEALTDRRFLAVAATREFDPPVSASGVLDLGQDLVSITGLTYGGTAWTAGNHYRLLPRNAAVDGKPYQLIVFNRRWAAPLPFSLYGSVAITGLWGYGVTIPEDAWQAMRAAGAISLLPAISYGLHGGLLSWTDADVSEKYGEDPLSGLAAGWATLRDGAVARYQRVTVG